MRRWHIFWRTVLSLSAVAIIILGIIEFQDGVAMNRASSGVSNVKNLMVSLQLYADDADGHYPPADSWLGLSWPGYAHEGCRDPELGGLGPPITETEALLKKNPRATLPGEWGYAFDSRLGGEALGRTLNPSTRIVIYQSTDLRWNAHDPGVSFRSGALGVTVGIADGHVARVPISALAPGTQEVQGNLSAFRP